MGASNVRHVDMNLNPTLMTQLHYCQTKIIKNQFKLFKKRILKSTAFNSRNAQIKSRTYLMLFRRKIGGKKEKRGVWTLNKLK